MELRDEREWLRRARSGDRRAAERLLESTYGQTFAALVKMTGATARPPPT